MKARLLVRPQPIRSAGLRPNRAETSGGLAQPPAQMLLGSQADGDDNAPEAPQAPARTD
jgi:hypothetical protein